MIVDLSYFNVSLAMQQLCAKLLSNIKVVGMTRMTRCGLHTILSYDRDVAIEPPVLIPSTDDSLHPRFGVCAFPRQRQFMKSALSARVCFIMRSLDYPGFVRQPFFFIANLTKIKSVNS